MLVKTRGDLEQEQAVLAFIQGAFNHCPQGSKAVAVYIMNAMYAYGEYVIAAKPEDLTGTMSGPEQYKAIARQLNDAMKQFIADQPVTLPIVTPAN